MNTTVHPQYGTRFDARDLVDHIRKSGSTYIIQGQQKCALAAHSKPNSLDVWMRNIGDLQARDTKQADNDVIQQLVGTGLFREGRFRCPDSGRKAKGIEIV